MVLAIEHCFSGSVVIRSDSWSEEAALSLCKLLMKGHSCPADWLAELGPLVATTLSPWYPQVQLPKSLSCLEIFYFKLPSGWVVSSSSSKVCKLGLHKHSGSRLGGGGVAGTQSMPVFERERQVLRDGRRGGWTSRQGSPFPEVP